MTRQAVIIAQALRAAGHDAASGARAAGIVVVLADLGLWIAACYFPPRPSDDQALLVLKIGPADDPEEFTALALAHHLLRHRSHPLYCYGRDGPLWIAPHEATEARSFAAVLMRPGPSRIQTIRRPAA